MNPAEKQSMVDLAILYDKYLQFSDIQTDTRKVKQGDFFVALKGPNFNGNTFVGEAFSKGAAFALLDEPHGKEDVRIIYTDNSLDTLQALALHHRKQLVALKKKEIPFIAITGSNGKTTTKELLHHVLSARYKTYTTEGNLNNHIGIPLTILKIRSDVEMAIIEMGANHMKEIESYCNYVLPTHGLITNCGKAHLEGFGSVENVAKGKGELFAFLREHKGVAFVNADDESVARLSEGIEQRIFYGEKGSDTAGKIVSADPFLKLSIHGNDEIGTQLVGGYNLPNVVAAVAVGRYFHVGELKIKAAIEAYYPVNNRSQLKKIDSNIFIIDTYNANPGSMKAAVENFAKMASGKKILMLGSMMELGPESQREHQHLVELIDNYDWNEVVLVGKNFLETTNRYHNFERVSQAKEWLLKYEPKNAHILLKGSRSTQMEKMLE